MTSVAFWNHDPVFDHVSVGREAIFYPFNIANVALDGVRVRWALFSAAGLTLPGADSTLPLAIRANPVREQLNIAWRGDLQRMSQRFEVHDMLGKPIVSGPVPDGDGAALWEYASVAAGAYIISIFDQQGDRLASEPIVKQ